MTRKTVIKSILNETAKSPEDIETVYEWVIEAKRKQYESENHTNPELLRILKAVSEATNVPEYFIRSKRRNFYIKVARFLFCYYAESETLETLDSIKDVIGYNDHTSVIHATQWVDSQANEKDIKRFAKKINKILGLDFEHLPHSHRSHKNGRKMKNLLRTIGKA